MEVAARGGRTQEGESDSASRLGGRRKASFFGTWTPVPLHGGVLALTHSYTASARSKLGILKFLYFILEPLSVPKLVSRGGSWVQTHLDE